MHGFLLKVIFDPNNLESIIDACIQSNRSAQRELFKRYFGYSKSICQRYTSGREEAEEVLNEGFLKVLNNLEKYDRSQPFKAWLRTILVNTAISHYRKVRRRQEHEILFDNDYAYVIQDEILSDISADEIMKVIRSHFSRARLQLQELMADQYPNLRQTCR